MHTHYVPGMRVYDHSNVCIRHTCYSTNIAMKYYLAIALLLFARHALAQQPVKYLNVALFEQLERDAAHWPMVIDWA